MSIAIIAPNRNLTKWKACFEPYSSRVKTEIWPDIEDPASVEMVILWDHPKRIMFDFPNLKLAGSFGAGVNHILNDEIPAGVRVVRCMTGGLRTSMTKYVLLHILRWHKNWDRLQELKHDQNWDQRRSEYRLSVGILGLGSLGLHLAKQLINLDIPAIGLSRSKGEREGVKCVDSIDDFIAAKTTVVVNLLPLTDDTTGILNKELFDAMADPFFLINVGRGSHLVEADLIPAIESGKIKEAVLDVFRQEPLPKGHEFWTHPKVVVSPHSAAFTNPKEASSLIVDNFERMKRGDDLRFEVDFGRGY